MRAWSWSKSHGGLAESLGRANAFGALRLMLAGAVLVSHLFPLGYGRRDPLWAASGGQTDLGRLAVTGFFVLSGFLITASGRRTRPLRFLRNRALRIAPGLLAAVLVTGFVIMPVLYWQEHGGLGGFWEHPHGPLRYLLGASPTDGSWDVSDVLVEGIERGTNHNANINGALWSLKYEALCYLLVALFAVAGVLRRAPAMLAVPAALLWVAESAGWLFGRSLGGGPFHLAVPVVGEVSLGLAVDLAYAFLLGAAAQVHQRRLPVHDGLAVVCATALAASLWWGGLLPVGFPALTYLTLWLAVRLPEPFRRIGRRQDYSYGVYIYGFAVEQGLAVFGVPRAGLFCYLVSAAVTTAGLALLSWHVVEAPALRLRGGFHRRPKEPSTS
ncbi:acyltransferase family protein [Kitasatospora sp. DSM 101779]|uniref:acyltransferase family protein n=1 Tax=Kitasatospora sp. DSM 101779 TaxID=2853165 RepID=UPI0021D7D648|nr:acyltransferase [Kitasatospora sp. DSM 101779]MCU7824277.1 acyltransferase [Kitasatospora sp. DSM 101779]